MIMLKKSMKIHHRTNGDYIDNKYDVDVHPDYQNK